MVGNVYFDTNVFDHIYKKVEVSKSDLLVLHSAIKGGKISVLLSWENLEEALSALKLDPGLAKAELRLMLDLTDKQRMLKPVDVLVSDDISSYARSKVSSPPFIVRSVIEPHLRALRRPGQEDVVELLSVVEATQKQKEGFKAAMEGAKKKILPEAKKLKGRRPSFNEYWKGLGGKFTESFAERLGVLEACKKQSINGLLELRSVRLSVGVNLSFIYAQTFEGHTPKIGDSRDIRHAILASATDRFVTQDREFRRLLVRIPIGDFKVMNLNSLIELIR